MSTIFSKHQKTITAVVTLTHGSGDAGRSHTLRVHDESSGAQILELTLNGANLAALISSSEATAHGEVTIGLPTERYGQHRWNVSAVLPDDFDGGSYILGDRRLRDAITADDRVSKLGAVYASVSKRNSGLALNLVGYSDSEPKSVTAARECRSNLKTLADVLGWKLSGASYNPTMETLEEDAARRERRARIALD